MDWRGITNRNQPVANQAAFDSNKDFIKICGMIVAEGTRW
jgi:hypothetical protein